ncbi:MAG TPA: ABC transporter permease [Terriglobales bacterium]
MKGYRILAMARKEVLQIRRDARSLGIVVLMPIIMMLIFGYGVSFDTKHIPVYVFDRDSTQASVDLLKHFQASDYFNVVRSVDNYRDLTAAVDSGACQLGIVIPPGFSAAVHSGGQTSVQAIVDGTDANTANVAMSYAQAIVRGYAQQAQINWIRKRTPTPANLPLSVETRTWFNEDLVSLATIVPGVIVMVMAVVGTFLTSLTIAREWERGTMEQLISTPIHPLEIMLGKLGPYVVIGMLDTTVCAAMGVLWFGVPFRGQVSVFLFSSFLFLCVVLSLGYFISIIAKTQLAASQAALLSTFLPAFLLSGFIFPIDQMPIVVQWITHIVPARYYMAILRAVFLKGSSVVFLWSDLIALLVFATFLVLVATRAFKKKLA